MTPRTIASRHPPAAPRPPEPQNHRARPTLPPAAVSFIPPATPTALAAARRHHETELRNPGPTCAAVVAEHARQLAVALRRLRAEDGDADRQQRLRGAASAREPALRRLRAAPSLGATLDRAPTEMRRIGGFDWAMISAVRAGALRPLARADGMGSDRLDLPAIPLTHTLPESDVVRRSRARLLPGGSSAEHPLVTAGAYAGPCVMAIIVVRHRVIGLLHAGRDAGVDDVDRDIAQAFGADFALLWERRLLRARMYRQRAAALAAMSRVNASFGEDPDDVVPAAAGPSRDIRVGTGLLGTETRLPLSRRQHQVLSLAAAGAPNRVIALELGIAEGTVKSHLKHVNRTLRTTSRNAAVARYLHALQSTAQDAAPQPLRDIA